MKRIPMIAIADFQWEGVWRMPGERLEVRPIEAAALRYQRRARFITGDDPVPFEDPPPVPALQETKEIVTRPRRRPRKRRQDIAKSPYTKVLH